MTKLEAGQVWETANGRTRRRITHVGLHIWFKYGNSTARFGEEESEFRAWIERTAATLQEKKP